MKRYEWASWTDTGTVNRRAAGRRRYNAMRQGRAWERRAAIDKWLCKHPWAAFFARGLPAALAPAFGVHPSTIWRDLQCILYPPREHDFYRNGELVFTIYRHYPGSPILSIQDPDGNEIRGEARRRIIRSLPRHFGRRR